MKNDKSFWGDNQSGKLDSENNADHQIVADDLPVLLCRFRKDGTIFFVNKSYSKFFNNPKENILNSKFFIEPNEFEKTDSSKPFLNQYKKQLAFSFADNSIRWIEWTVNRVHEKLSEGFEYQAIGHDITELKLLEERLTKFSVDVNEQKKSEELEKTLYQISHSVISNDDLNNLYKSIHASLANIVPVENFFIAIYDKEKNLLSFPYMVDEFDEPYETAPPGKGLTEYVLRSGKALHVDQQIFQSLVDSGEVDLYGTDSLDWIGVPLKIADVTIGVLVVQSYNEKIRLGERDLNVLIYVSDQIALAIERTRTHNLLISREERYRLLFDKAADLIAIIDPQGKVLDTNNIFEEETGYKRTDIIGANVFESGFLTSKSSVSTAFYLSKILLGSEVPIFEIEFIKKDASLITYELRGVPIEEKNELIGVQVILRNVSERKKTEAKLHQSEKQLSYLMSNLPGMAYRCKYDSDWTMEFVSQGCFELTGYFREDLILNNKVAYAELIHPEDKENVFVTIRESVNKNIPYQLIYRIRTKDGFDKWVWEKGSAQISKRGKVESLEGFVSDISSRINAEVALKESEELYRKLIATLPDIIAITDVNGNIIFMNEIGIKFSGYSNFEDIKNEHFLKFIADEDKARVTNDFNETFLYETAPYEYQFVNKFGEKYLFEVQREILRNTDNAPYGLIFSCRDITSRKKAEIELAQSEVKYRTLIDSIQDGVFLIENGIISFVNKAFCKMIGLEINEITGQPFTKFVAPEDIDLVVGNYKLRQEGKPAPTSYEWRMLHKNGGRVDVNMSARVINYQGKNATIGTLKDITHQKRLERVLLNQKNLFKGVSDAANILLTERDFDVAISNTLKSLGQSSDIDRVYIFENSIDKQSNQPMMSQKYEWTNGAVSQEINNPNLTNLHYFPMFESWYPVLANGETVNSLVKDLNEELKNLLSIQSIKSILLSPIMVKNQFWGFIGFDYCQSDRVWSESEISILQTTAANLGGFIERELSRKELIEAKETAEDMSKLKSNFLANMSHELRTPLIAILGYTEILNSEIEHYEWNDMISTIMQSGKRLLETLNLILDLSKVEADKVQINYNELNISEEIYDIVTMLAPVAQKKELYLKAEVENNIVLSKLDKRLFHSIITNLVNNAIKYTKTGGIVIGLSVLKSSNNSYAMIRVADTGIGIAKEDQETIFEEFRQVSEGYNRHFEGAGLGLTIAKKFTEKMGGSISLESEAGKGSVFTVVFPVAENKVKLESVSIATKEDLLPKPIGKKKKVLVIDDDLATRKIVELFLRGEIEIESASNSKEATDLINNDIYSLVLMDISLGKGISGIELLHNLRMIPAYKNIPVIAVTAHAMVGDKEKFLESGFDDYLSKPFGKKDLISKVHTWVTKNSTG